MIRSTLIASCSLMMAVPAFATVCQSHGSVVADYEYAAASATEYVIAVGHLENVQPSEALDSAGTYRQLTRFEGAILIGDAFAPGWSEDIEVTGLCQGGGCGAHQAARDGLFFFERSGAEFSFVADVCGGLVYYAPSRADIEAVIQCHNGHCP